ncbi:MAG: glycosyltransferase family 4 protein [Azonexus sp.]
MAIKVVLLTQWFDPEPTFKGLAFARELVRIGFEVEVITGFPNYPGGQVYSGYRIRAIQREVIDGVQITRLPLYPSHDGSAVRRIANYVSFAASSLFYGLFMLKRPDVIYAYHPPLTVGVTASLLRLFRRIPVIYDIQDMWPDTLRATGMLNNERVLAVVSRVCQWVYRRVDRIVALSPGFKRLLKERGVPDEKIDVIYNWCDEAALTPTARNFPRGFPENDRFRIVFAGNMGRAQALGTVMEAATLLTKLRPEVCFVLVGSGVEVEELKHRVATEGLDNVVFIPRVPMSEVGAILGAADALLVHLKDDPLFAITIPSKTQAYMAIGKPLIMAVRGDAAELVERAGCGVTAIPESPQSLAEAVIRLAELSAGERALMGECSRRFYAAELSLAVGVAHFASHFRALARRAV